LRLIDGEGNQLGVVSNREAKRLAQESELDLVEIAPNANPPVCRLMDYLKYLYEQNKQKAAAKKKQKKVSLKEMAFRPNTGKGDYLVKVKKLIAFLEDGDKVRVSVRYRGRELSHQELGVQLIEMIKMDLEPYGVIEMSPKMEGRQMAMLVAPKRKETK
jgi:translation initiation factor IF-3